MVVGFGKTASWLRKRKYLVTVVVAITLGTLHFVDRREIYLPGVTSDGHHAIEASCASCHEGFEAIRNTRCQECHTAELFKDTHSVRLFDDPRWAADLAVINASRCITCHAEHRVARGGVTVAPEFCFPCHDDVVQKRASHRTFASTSCGDAGCHNYHDNSTVNTAFLSLRAGQSMMTNPAQLPTWQRSTVSQAVQSAATRSGVNLPPPQNLPASDEITRGVAGSAHGRAQVGCGDCHSADGPDHLRPGIKVCQRCHEFEVETFTAGRHGSRLRVELEPLGPGDARLPMKPSSETRPVALDCGTCHDPHAVDTRPAATEACLTCHDDEHSRNFKASTHAALPGATEAASPSAVTCATCHLPRTEVTDEAGRHVAVNHNNSFTLRPTDRMARMVCLHCHGLELSLTSVLDPRLVASNFDGRPSDRHPTFSLIESHLLERKGGQNAPGGSP